MNKMILVPIRLTLFLLVTSAFTEYTVVSVVDNQCGMSNCTCCATTNCTSSGFCNEGCKPGYHGGRCRNKCPQYCTTCTDHPDAGENRPDLYGIGYCIECKEGHYLTNELYQCQSSCSYEYCNSVNLCEENCHCCADNDCSERGYCVRGCQTAFPKCIVVSVGDDQCGRSDCKCCATNRCNTTSGVCSDGCKPGYHGGRCKNKCPENCISCTDHPDAGQNRPKLNGIGYCKECKEGHFFTDDLYQCQSTCSSGCKACTSKSQCLSCVDGHIPDLQNPGSCILCVTVCLSCEINGCSSCKKGFFITSIQEYDLCDVCPDGCLSCVSNRSCTTCVNGLYGTRCEKVCSIGCKTNCRKDDGFCECKDEFTGQKCDTCISGRYGTKCTEMCPKNCQNSDCERESGYCFDCEGNHLGLMCGTCINGYYGTNCDINCPSNCLNNTCEQTAGNCSLGCNENFDSEQCDKCKPGKFGRECVNDCPKRCLNKICKIMSGICNDCYSNFTGDTCEKCIDGLYGVECYQTCPPNCRDNICDKQTGICKHDCAGGFSGDMCCLNNSFCDKCLSYDECGSCIRGKHGETCENDCPMNCKYRSCNKINGSCTSCKNGFHGQFCVDAIFQPNKQERNSIAAQIAGTLSGIAILSLTVVIVVFYRRRRYTGIKENKSRLEEAEEQIYANADTSITVQPDRLAAEVITTQNLERRHTQSVHNEALSIPLNEIKSLKSDGLDESKYDKTLEISSTKIQISRFADHVKGHSSALFIKEFQALPKGLLKPCTDARKPVNLAKNRYNFIFPYDDDRVKLNPPGSDFINACYIDGYKKKREYIASLGPIVKATDDFKTFWRMVWQENTEKIVMVTNLLEKGGMKCEKYWPEVCATNSYGDVIVMCHSEETFAEYTLRKLTVLKGDKKRSLFHIHYTAWPDKAVPDDVTSLIDFRQKVNSIKTTANGKTIVHCSAGVGRTGTYIALDILTQEGETEGTVDVFGCVSRMRHQRTHMVQTWEQYEYLHHALVHTLTFDYRPIAAEEFEEYVSTCSDAVMVANFKRLHSVKENVPESEGKAKQRNNLLQHLNRKDADVPGDIRRPILYEGKTERDNDYINAIYLNSYRQKDRYIMAMTPLPETVTDFLTLLIQEKVTCVVSLDDEDSEHLLEHHVKGTYLPTDNQTLEIGAFVVKSYRVTNNSCYEQRSLQVTMDTVTETKSQTLHHFQISHWPEGTRVPHDDARFLQLITAAEKAADDREEKGTMVVHCLNAAERSCLFCAISIMLQKMDTDHEASVVNTLRQVRVRRPLAIPNKEQYVFCHKCICTHLQSGDSNRYTNRSM